MPTHSSTSILDGVVVSESSSPQTRNCPKCNTIKSVDEFAKNRATRTGLEAYCRICQGELGRKRMQRRKALKGSS